MSLKFTQEMFLGDGLNSGLVGQIEKNNAMEAAEIAQAAHDKWWSEQKTTKVYGIEKDGTILWYEMGDRDPNVTHTGLLINIEKMACRGHVPQSDYRSSDGFKCRNCGAKIVAHTTWELAE